MRLDRNKFFDGFRDRLDSTIEQEQVEGLEFILGRMENDPFWKHIPQIAYALATVFHETAGSFQPVEEGYYLGAKAKAFQKKLRYFPWFGRGYVQLTWKRNYELAKRELDVDFIADPNAVMDPANSYRILTLGMHQGWFTGKKLDDYIKSDEKDYVEARKIINGTDKAGLIAGYARSFEKILTASLVTNDSNSPEIAGIEIDDPTEIVSTTGTTQIADNIVNTAPQSLPPAEDKSVAAPVKDGATSDATKLTVAGIVVPGFIVAGIKTVQDLIAQGYVSASDVGSTVLSFIKENQRYVFLLIGLLILLLIVKKLIKQITFWIEILTKAIPGWNNITVIPTPVAPVQKKWWEVWK